MLRNIFRWGAVAAAAAGCVMYVVSALTSGETMPWLNEWMVVPIVALTIVPIVWSLTSAPSRSEFRDGDLGIGTLVEVHRTGLTVNDQPQLDIVFDVDTATGEAFRGTARQIVDLTELSALTPGTMLPVRYLPGRADGRVGIATDADSAEVQALMQQVQLAKGQITPRQLLIAQQGVQAQAVVMEMQPTGEVRHGNAVIALRLRVTRPDGTTFDTRVEKAVPPAAIAGVQAGMVVRARYLAHDEEDVSLEVRAG